MMTNYEAVFVFKPDLEEAAREEILTRLKDVITESGEIKEIEDWGNRKLAYEINYIKEGHYMIIHFVADGSVVKELERRARISDHIIRYLVIKVED